MSKKKKGLVPELRFPEFMGEMEWKLQSLGIFFEEYRESSRVQDEYEVLTSSRDGLVRQSEYYENSRIIERDNIGFNVIPPQYITYRSRSDDRRFFFNENNLGITGIISTYYPVFRIVNGNNKFFIELLSHNSIKVGMLSVGTSQTVLSLNQLKKLKLPIPLAAEQQKIADCLASIDELITLHTQKLDALKDHKKGLMQQLFPAEGGTEPKLRFPEFNAKGAWKTYPLGSAGQNLDSKRVPITEKDRVKGNFPYYGASGVIDYVNDYIFDEELLCISEDGANLRARTYPIAFSIAGKTWVNNHAHVIRFEHKSTQTLVENYLNSVSLEDYLTGMAQPKLNRAKLDIIPIPLPSLEERAVIADFLTSLDELISHQASTVENLVKHKEGLIQKLFPVMDEVN